MTKKLTDEEKAARALNRRRRQADRSWEPTFIAILATTGSIKYACQQARIARSTAYEHKDLFEDFSQRWEEAEQDALDDLVAAARARALKNSDLLLMFLIKQRDPSYRDNYRIEHTTPADQPFQISNAEREKAQAEITAWRDEQNEQLAGLISLFSSALNTPNAQ